MSDISPIANGVSAVDISAASAASVASPDPGFSRIMDDALLAAEATQPNAPAAATAVFNAYNLLNGQYPPPDSGAGYTFTTVALHADPFA